LDPGGKGTQLIDARKARFLYQLDRAR